MMLALSLGATLAMGLLGADQSWTNPGLGKFACDNMKVTGKMDRDTIAVTKIAKAS
jgi:hypothetical protein